MLFKVLLGKLDHSPRGLELDEDSLAGGLFVPVICGKFSGGHEGEEGECELHAQSIFYKIKRD